MLKECVIVDGRVENIGPWQYLPTEIDGVTTITNPFPVGGVIELREVVQDADGAWRCASDYYNLRRVAYPDVRDQLDALFKGGEEAEAMSARIAAVKELYPKE